MNWLIAPLSALLILSGSAYLSALEDTTQASTALAQTSEDAPRTTQDAAEGVEDLPAAADLTEQQADAFETLADALGLSAERVANLEKSLADQATSLEGLGSGLASVGSNTGCIERRLRRLADLAGLPPAVLGQVTARMRGLIEAQDKSLRHLRSINRKLTAFGVVATATDVEAPPPPPDAPPPSANGDPRPAEC